MPGLLSKERIIAPADYNRWRVPVASGAIHLCIGSFWFPNGPYSFPLISMYTYIFTMYTDHISGPYIYIYIYKYYNISIHIFIVSISTFGMTFCVARWGGFSFFIGDTGEKWPL